MNVMFAFLFFFFNDTATTEIYTLSLHDALPISRGLRAGRVCHRRPGDPVHQRRRPGIRDRKSTRLNSSHSQISYAVFCLKKKKKIEIRVINATPAILQATHTSQTELMVDMQVVQ